MFGGLTYHKTNPSQGYSTNALWSYTNLQWSNLTAASGGPAGRAAHAAVLDGPTMYIFGGVFLDTDSNVQTIFNDLWFG